MELIASAVKIPCVILSSLFAVAGTLPLTSCKGRTDTTQQRLPQFALAPTDYGWRGSFLGEPRHIFQQEISVQIDTRAVPDAPKVLPPVSDKQATLVRIITASLPALLQKVEEAMVSYNDHDPDFRKFVRNPHVWLDSEEDNGESWALVIERSDNPDFGYHVEFKGTNLVEIWAGN